jgi:hypothetical protein
MITYSVLKIDTDVCRPDLVGFTLDGFSEKIKEEMKNKPIDGVEFYGIYDEPPIFPSIVSDSLPNKYLINGSLEIQFSNPNIIENSSFPHLHSISDIKKLVRNGGAKYVCLQGNNLGIMPISYDLKCGEHQLTLTDQNIFEMRL